MSTSIAKAVAAWANTYGGLVLVGVTDDRRVTRRQREDARTCVRALPRRHRAPWVPEIVPVPMDDDSGK